MLTIKNLSANVDDKPIISGIDLVINFFRLDYTK